VAFGAEAGILVGIVTTVISSVANFPAEDAAIIGAAAKLTFGARTSFCCATTDTSSHAAKAESGAFYP